MLRFHINEFKLYTKSNENLWMLKNIKFYAFPIAIIIMPVIRVFKKDSPLIIKG